MLRCVKFKSYILNKKNHFRSKRLSSTSADIREDEFAEILSFHSGVAAVRDNSKFSYHINLKGEPIYAERFSRTFGFYAADRAAVIDFSGKSFHIDKTGKPVYTETYDWCGNFTSVPGSARAPVRNKDRTYFLIDPDGKKKIGPFAYAGDSTSNGQCVVWKLDGSCRIVNMNGEDWCPHASNWLEVCAPHKGIAAVRDENGWFFVDSSGKQVGSSTRYQEIEPHYNGQARVKKLNGQWTIIDEQGTEIVPLPESTRSAAIELERISKLYWKSFALKRILDKESSQDNFGFSPLQQILTDVGVELGLTSLDPTTRQTQLTQRGLLLQQDSLAADRCRYWLQDRYVRAWTRDLSQEKKLQDTFQELADDSEKLTLSHRVLKSYADADWLGITALLPQLERPAKSIVDIGGGMGSILQEIESQTGSLRDLVDSQTRLICFERPEVANRAAQAAITAGSKVLFVPGDMFLDPMPPADLYLMSRVLHDWDDTRATEVLQRLFRDSPASATLVVIDRETTPENLHALLSLHMFSLNGAYERSADHWGKLFYTCGWRVEAKSDFNNHVVYTLRKSEEVQVMKKERTTENQAKKTFIGRPGKAVIPIAGLGTRMAPQSSVTPKALLPVISADETSAGLVASKITPALTHLLDQLLSPGKLTGVGEVGIVASPVQMSSLDAFLSTLPGGLREKITVIPQYRADGLGDAVLCARRFIGSDDAFMVVLSDHLFSSGCVAQLVKAYEEVNTSGIATGLLSEERLIGVTGATFCEEAEVPRTGLLGFPCEFTPRVGSTGMVSEMLEKPSSGFHHLGAHDGGSNTLKFPSQLGIDILPTKIFEALAQENASLTELRNQSQIKTDLCLRTVMQKSLVHQGLLYSHLVDGERLDIGTPETYLQALARVSEEPHFFQKSEPHETSISEEEIGFLTTKKILQSVGYSPPPAVKMMLSSEDGIHLASAPGRIDLMGGFADYSGSRALQHHTDKRVMTLATSCMITSENSEPWLHLAAIQVSDLNVTQPEIEAMRTFSVPLQVLLPRDVSIFLSQTEIRDRLLTYLNSTNHIDSRWPLYIAGVLHAMMEAGEKIESLLDRDVALVTISDLPWNSGLASSAAVEVSTALAVGHLLEVPHSLLQPKTIAQVCQRVENLVVGAHCGIMDHLAVSHSHDLPVAHSPSALVVCDCSPALEKAPYSLSMLDGLSVVAMESGVRRSVASVEYAAVRVAAEVGRAIINEELRRLGRKEVGFLCELPPSEMLLYRRLLPDSVSAAEILDRWPSVAADFSGLESFQGSSTASFPIFSATTHPVDENNRVGLCEVLLRRGISDPGAATSLAHVGEMMAQAHRSYANCGLGCTHTDTLTDVLYSYGGDKVVGAKVSGGGSGGAVVALLKDMNTERQYEDFWDRVKHEYFSRSGLDCTPRFGGNKGSRYHGSTKRLFSTESRRPLPRVLVVNHGYPPEFNGGSEVYAQTLALQLLNSGSCSAVQVFTREHDPYRPDFVIRHATDALNENLPVTLMNYPREAPYFRFMAEPVDQAFKEVVDQFQPDVVHFHHLNHLSLGLPAVAKAVGAKVVYTLHDYWLMCPRGQFLVTGVTSPENPEPWRHCDGQENRKCATQCYVGRYATSGYSTNREDSAVRLKEEEEYWTKWIDGRMKATREACDNVDLFIAPSKYIFDKYTQEFKLPKEKIMQEPYGFDRSRLTGRNRSRPLINGNQGEPFVFAYIGRHQPAKGINLLVSAALQLLEELHPVSNNDDFSSLSPAFRINIYGRQDANSSRALRRLIDESPHPLAEKVFQWGEEYVNSDVVEAVFNQVDCIVVPSIWEENSPLVIQEAQQCRVPVLTADAGGMGELVEDGINGLTFKHRDVASLAAAMHKAVEQPLGMEFLGQRGYLHSPDGQIPGIEQHTRKLLFAYQDLMAHPQSYEESSPRAHQEKSPAAIQALSAPWRVTFDTNPDDCNFSCTMCEQHSEFSPHQKKRVADKIRRRRLDFGLVRKVVAELAPRGLREIIPTTMGEPLMYKHFPLFLDLCHEYGVKLNLTTNGSFYQRGAVEWARVIVPVGSDVKISWNGITAETQAKIMKRSDIGVQIDNLKAFLQVRDEVFESGGNYCSVTLQLTFMEDNLSEFPALVRFAIELGCDRVKGHHLWAHFPELKDQNLRRSEASIARWNSVAKECRDIADQTPLKSGKLIKLENFFDLEPGSSLESQQEGDTSFAQIHPNAVCPFLGKEAWVNHEGRFDPCCAPDEERKGLGSFGNLRDSSMLDLWESEKYKDLVEKYLSHDLCKGCNMRRPPET